MKELRDAYYPGTELLRSDEIRVIALGTGRPFQRMAQANSGWLLELGNGDIFVFDFGFGSFSRFTALEMPIAAITGLFTTHLHSDHVGDFAAYWVGARTGGRLEPLKFFGPSGGIPEHGFAHFVEHQILAYKWDADTRRGLLPLAGETVDVTEFEWSASEVIYDHDGVRISSFPAVHIHDGAVGLRLDWKGLSVVYSGDTAPSRFLLDASESADLLIHESFNTSEQLMRQSGYDSRTAHGVGSLAHTQPLDAGRVFDLVNPGFAVATHFNNDFDTGLEVAEEIRRSYSGPLALAQDLMVFNLRPGQCRVRKVVTSAHTWPQKRLHAGFATAERGDPPVMAEWLRAGRLQFEGA